MKINKQRRKLLMMGGWLSSGWLLSGCGGGGAQQSTSVPSPVVAFPDLVSHPESQVVTDGEVANFSVVATGDSLIYQWQQNGVNILGASGVSYTTPPVTSADNGMIFSVVVTNAAGSVISNAALLVVVGPAVSADSLVTTVDSMLITVDEA